MEYDEGLITRTCAEHELLLHCTRTYVDPVRAEQTRSLLNQEIDWVYLLKLADRHSIMPLLYWRLIEICPDAVPLEILSQLRERFKKNTWHNLFLTGELIRILALIKSRRVTAVPFKGPALAALLYGNLALRDFGDLDIVIHEKDIPQVRKILIDNGYRPQFRLTQVQESALPKYRCEHAFTSGDGKIVIDLHWRFDPPYLSFSAEPQLSENDLETVVLGGKEVLTFPSEDLLLILCLHGAKHSWERIGWICDVASLIEVKKTMDWERVLRLATTQGCERMLFLGIWLAKDLMGADLPKEILQRASMDSKVVSLATQVAKNLFEQIGFSKGFKEIFFYLFS